MPKTPLVLLLKKAQIFLFSVFVNRILLFSSLPILMGAVFSFSLLLFNAQTVVRGVTLVGTRVDMLSYETLSSFVGQETESFMATPVTIVLPDNTVEHVPLETLGAQVEAQRTVNQIFSIGHKNNILSDDIMQLQALFEGMDASYQAAIDEKVFSNFIENDLAQFNHPTRNTQPVYSAQTNSFALQEGQSGIIIDKQKFENDLRNRLAHLSTQEIILRQRADVPPISYVGAENAETEANKLLKRLPLVLQYDEGTIPVKQSDVISWINFTPDTQTPTKLTLSFDRQKIQDYLTLVSPGLNKEPLDARFHMENNRVVAFQLSQGGRSLDIAQSASKIIQALSPTSSSTNSGQTTLSAPVDLVFTPIEPAITESNINNLGITKLLASGTTDFSGSHKSRIINIGIGSQKYEGVLIAPGEEFSFDKILGDVGPQQGYLPELVIKKGGTVPEYGGGLCQVSTTMFRAAILAGLQITERYNHAYVVRYYGTPGFDATIYPPHPDLRFVNNTPGYILIQHQIIGTKLSFEFFGTDDGRKVEVDGPFVYDKQTDGSMKAVLTQKVFDAQGAMMFEKKIYSSYASSSLYPVEKNPLE